MARILVIEDNAASQELMVYLLQAFGHTVSAAADGEEGLAAAERSPPDLIVCDVHLPRKDGYEVALHFKDSARLGRIPLVAVTALAMVGDNEKVMAAGFDAYISKPIVPYTFVSEVETCLPEPQRRAALGPITPAADAPTAMVHPRRRATILAVDDLHANRELLRSTLEPFGYTVIGLRSVTAALTVARRVPPDLILSDLRSSDRDGFEFVRVLRVDPRLRSVPCIVLSSSMWNEGDRHQLLALGADRFLRRPVEPQELVDTVEQCLRLRCVP